MIYIIIAIVVILAAIFVHFKRSKKRRVKYPQVINCSRPVPAYPDLKIAIMSDPHYYDRSLGDDGPAFEAYLLTDRKLVKESAELIDLAVNEILLSDAEVVLIPGDLSCEGELLSHQGMANALTRLKDNGRRIYVIPGNHDINMLHGAVRYRGIHTEQADTISAEKFAQIYWDFGYREALYRDDHSLSYVAPISDQLWLVAIDTCRYRDNTADLDQVGSRLTQSLIDWLAAIFNKAADQNIAVMAMIHHGVVEHWSGQGKLHPDFLVDDYKEFNRFLASAGVRLVFSGHYHAQDIAKADYGKDGFIYDVETSSLITPPCPLRFAALEENKLEVRSVNLIDKLRPGTNFADEANAFMVETLEYEIVNTLRKYLVNDQDSQLLAKYVALAFAAHSKGDEDPGQKPVFDHRKLSFWGRVIYARQKIIIDNLWTNQPPGDLNVSLEIGLK